MIKRNKETTETELQYIWRICSAKDSGALDCTWNEVGEIINSNLYPDDEDHWLSESAYRKKYQYGKTLFDEVFSKMESDDYHKEVMDLKRELERSKIQFRDERNAWQRQNYIAARVEQKLDCLEEKLSEIGRVNYDIVETNRGNSTDLLVILSDLHIGQTFSSNWGSYNTDIAKDRLNQYLNEIITIANRHGSDNVYVSLQGDLISGSIHKTLAITNRENVIEQIKIASELIASFCIELSEHFKNVYVSNVSGNHSRIDTKADALHSERLDDLIGWAVKSITSTIKNITFTSDYLDNGISILNIRDKKYVCVHGDYDNFSKSGVTNLVMMLGYIPYAVCMGHLHTCALDECSGVKMIRSGSLAGAGDSYTIEKRLCGKPSQMVCVCGDKGIEAYYTVELN